MSLVGREIIVTEVDEDVIPKLDKKDEKLAHLKEFKWWEKKEYERTIEDYVKFSRVMRKDVSTVCGVMHGLCDAGLRNRIEMKPPHQVMTKNNWHCTIVLCGLVKNNCNGSTSVVIDNVLGNLIEVLLNDALIRGE